MLITISAGLRLGTAAGDEVRAEYAISVASDYMVSDAATPVAAAEGYCPRDGSAAFSRLLLGPSAAVPRCALCARIGILAW